MRFASEGPGTRAARGPSWAWVLLLGLLAGGCSEELTELVVVVDAEHDVPGALDRVVVQTLGFGDPGASPDERVGGESEARLDDGRGLPRYVALRRLGGPVGPFEIRVTGYLGGDPITRRRAVVNFVPGERRALVVQLATRCTLARDEACAEQRDSEECSQVGCTCGADGACVDAVVPSDRLALWTGDPTTVDAAPRDAGADGAVTDASGPDMEPVDMADMATPDMAPPDMSPPDMSPPDMSPPDMSPPDMSPPDMSPPDMSPPDMGPPDMTPPDMSPLDMGPPDMAPPDMGCTPLACGGACTCSSGCCDASCAPGASCSVTCMTASACTVAGADSRTLDIECTDARCDVTATNVDDANITCASGATCDVDCTDAVNCDLRCRSSSCLVRCAGASGRCRIQSCMGGATTCAGDVFVCGRGCPP